VLVPDEWTHSSLSAQSSATVSAEGTVESSAAASETQSRELSLRMEQQLRQSVLAINPPKRTLFDEAKTVSQAGSAQGSVNCTAY